MGSHTGDIWCLDLVFDNILSKDFRYEELKHYSCMLVCIIAMSGLSGCFLGLPEKRRKHDLHQFKWFVLFQG